MRRFLLHRVNSIADLHLYQPTTTCPKRDLRKFTGLPTVKMNAPSETPAKRQKSGKLIGTHSGTFHVSWTSTRVVNE